MTSADSIIKELAGLGDEALAVHHAGFFKTGVGQYGQGDLFLGLKTPDMRKVAKKYQMLPLDDIEALLHNKYHEARSLALTLLSMRYAKADLDGRRQIVDLYLKNVAYINNWDLVDISAYKIIGAWVHETHETPILYQLAASKHLWSERISIVSCLYLIKKKEYADFQKLAASFLTHPHDLMHKAVGWMLREMGKQNEKELLGFLDKHAARMPRTMLRYALEKLPPELKKHYMTLKVK